MLLRKIGTLLSTEVKWGRLALLALGASAVALLVGGGAFNLLSLTVFSIVGIFVERVAPKHPFVNALFYGLLGVLFYVVLSLFQALGLGESPSAADILWLAISAAIVVVPQGLLGTWIGTSIRKFGRAAAEARKGERTSPPSEKAGGTPPAGSKAARPPRSKPESPPPSEARRKQKG